MLCGFDERLLPQLIEIHSRDVLVVLTKNNFVVPVTEISLPGRRDGGTVWGNTMAKAIFGIEMDTDGDVYLRGTAITSLPGNLTVGGSLYLSGTAITTLPDNLTVGGKIYGLESDITPAPQDEMCGGRAP
jgi:hypothetical protein